MVEQSVISLGDEENEGEEDGLSQDNLAMGELCDEGNHHDPGAQSTNGYYNQLERNAPESERHRHRRRRKSSSGEQQQQIHQVGSERLTASYQDDYEQITGQQMASEDRNSNSSGIYRRRGHINERAFSYSIRQEASKSSADNSDAEYRNGELSDSNYQSNMTNNNNIKYHLSQQQMHQQQQQQRNMAHYDEPQQQDNIYQDRQPVQYYKQHPSQQHQQQPVDELSARLENQLNMKSFANSCVKSHM